MEWKTNAGEGEEESMGDEEVLMLYEHATSCSTTVVD